MRRTRPSKLTLIGSLIAAAVLATASRVAPAGADCPVLDVPQNVSASQGDDCTIITISWLSVDGASGYDIVRTNPDHSTTQVGFNWASTSFPDYPPLRNGTTYQYRVAAHGIDTSTNPVSDCYGPPADNVSGFTKPNPLTPRSLTITDVNSTTIHLAWPAVTWATGFRVWRYELTTGPRTLVVNVTSGTAIGTDYTETECGTHKYGVTALGCAESGERQQTHQAPITPTSGAPLPPPLSSPINNALVCSPSTVLSWGVGCLATSYRIQVSSDPTFATTLLDVTTTDLVNRHVTASGLQQSTTYYWQVQSINASGQSDWSTAASFVTGKVPYVASSSAPWVTRNFAGPVYWGQTGTATMHPDAAGCPCNSSWTLSGGGP